MKEFTHTKCLPSEDPLALGKHYFLSWERKESKGLPRYLFLIRLRTAKIMHCGRGVFSFKM